MNYPAFICSVNTIARMRNASVVPNVMFAGWSKRIGRATIKQGIGWIGGCQRGRTPTTSNSSLVIDF
jgi:hypothetical protein